MVELFRIQLSLKGEVLEVEVSPPCSSYALLGCFRYEQLPKGFQKYFDSVD